MCNAFGNNIPYRDYLAAFSQTRIPVKWPAAAPNLEPRDDIWPTDRAPVIRRLGDGTNEFSVLRWGFPPARPKGPPVINFRSEDRRFPVGRCLGGFPRGPLSEFHIAGLLGSQGGLTSSSLGGLYSGQGSKPAELQWPTWWLFAQRYGHCEPP
jgi:hypothetical protein